MKDSSTRVTTNNLHRQVQTSTTLNRRYVKRPVKNTQVATTAIGRSPRIQHFNHVSTNSEVAKGGTMMMNKKIVVRSQAPNQPQQPPKAHPIESAARAKMRANTEVAENINNQKLTARQIKEQAIQKALASTSNAAKRNESVKRKTKREKISKIHFGIGRIFLALSCTAAALFAIAYFVNLNVPDISLKVAAMQTGIEASYPAYVPRDYKLSSITSENSKVSLSFKNSGSDAEFLLTEEKSSWDSSALLTNYVKEAFGESNYTTVREQGLTIYISESNAAWVNGGIVYKIEARANTLTNKQICSIAVSL